ncbi:MAG: BREX-2 system adenine-specific DNA-methyltransferase PglX, partial [Verrucomicrobiales bacterium]
HRPPIASQIRLVGAIKREDDEPVDPANGLVWSAILAQVDQPGSQSEYVSVGDVARELFHKHPWSIGGGGAAELKEQLEEAAALKLETLVDCIGFSAILGEDEAFGSPVGTNRMRRLPGELRRPIIEGDKVRDWNLDWESEVLFPYTTEITLRDDQLIKDWFWPLRCVMSARADFSKRTYAECGRPYWEYHQIPVDRNRTPLSLVFCEVTTHNHFVLDRGGKVFKQTAPVIKLPRESTEGDHLALLGLLNSSVGGFWIKQVCHCKGGGGIGGGIASESWERFYAFNGTKLQQFPLPVDRPLLTARWLDILATRARDSQPASITSCGAPTRAALDTAKSAAQFARSQMIAAQEELDWECYRLYGLIAAPTERQGASRRSQADEEPAASALRLTTMQPPPLKLGQRAFEIVLARKMAAGETQTTWFERHGSTPITELPAEWPDDYRQLVERRIALIASDPNIRLIEQPEYKRRWNTEPWDTQLERALREWLLDRLESYFDFDGRMQPVLSPGGTPEYSLGRQPQDHAQPNDPSPGGATDHSANTSAAPPGLDAMVPDANLGLPPQALFGRPSGVDRPAASALPLTAPAPLADIALVSIAKLADVARQDAEFQQVGELFRDDPAFDVQALVVELVAAECVPLLPVLRYKPSGLIKRGVWERTWDLQRQEDAIDARTKLPST